MHCIFRVFSTLCPFTCVSTPQTAAVTPCTCVSFTCNYAPHYNISMYQLLMYMYMILPRLLPPCNAWRSGNKPIVRDAWSGNKPIVQQHQQTHILQWFSCAITEPSYHVLQVLAGYRLDKPQSCSQEVYNLMRRCWQMVSLYL